MSDPGAIIASSNPGDLSGGAALPGNMGSIMQTMFSQMVTPEQINLNGNGAPTVQVVGNPAPASAPVVPPTSPASAPASAPAPNTQPDVNLFTEEPKVAPPPVDDEPDMSDVPDDPKAENWKRAREALKNERKSLRSLTQEFEQVKSKLEKYEKGEVVPEIITAKDLRIQELEKYETIVSGKLSDEYQTMVVEPAAEKKQALAKLAEDYGVSPAIQEQLIQRIVATENEKERNQLITKYFPDALGASKVEGLVQDLHELGSLALEMEKQPTEVMQRIQAEYRERKQQEAAQVASQFESVSKVAWTKALEKTAAEGLFPELIIDPTNAERSKVAESNQHRAGIQYGALVKKLHENGLKNLPEDLATGLARSIQLAIGSVGVAKQLEAAQRRIAELEGNNGMIATYLRPGVNTAGNARPVVNTNTKGPMSPKEAGQAALAVFNRR